MSGIVQIHTDRIRPLSVQRDVYEPSKFRRLKKDIDVNGLMNPILSEADAIGRGFMVITN